MMRKLSIGIMLLVVSAHSAGALTSMASPDPLDSTEDASGAYPPAANIWAQPAPPHVQVVTAPPAPAPAPARILSANPLWAIPLATLSGTRERPIFSSSRRPPPPAVAPASAPKIVAAPKPKEPERPQLTLVGTIVSDDEAFGIFLDQSTKAPLRLKVGDDYQGWKLQSVHGREVILEKDQQAVTLELPRPDGGQAADQTGYDARPVVTIGKSFAVAPQPPPSEQVVLKPRRE